MSNLGKYSFGIGDRFGIEGKAQLRAILKMKDLGIPVTPVWNKSHREHLTVGSKPENVREEADNAVRELQYNKNYFVDADHINLKNVDGYISYSDFFTIDVADFIGKRDAKDDREDFFIFFEKFSEGFNIPGIENKIKIDRSSFNKMADTFLLAMKKAGEIYFHIKSLKKEDFCTEVSIDEVEEPQSPVELFFILAALSYYKVPVNTIAPKFTGRFNKGVDYEGDLKQFGKEFEEDLHVLSFCVKELGFSEDLKLSVHSGSDKFSIYPVMNGLIKKHKSGLHVKTAGTTWLEELIGLAESEGEAFNFALEVYEKALSRFDELTEPYSTVLDIDKDKLPSLKQLKEGGGAKMAAALRHEVNSAAYNPHLRQLMHCAYKIAAEEGNRFLELLIKHRDKIEKNVTQNLFEKHLVPIFNQPESAPKNS